MFNKEINGDKGGLFCSLGRGGGSGRRKTPLQLRNLSSCAVCTHPGFAQKKKFLSFLSKFKEFSFSIASGKEGALEEEEEEKERESFVSVVSFPLNLPEIRCKRTGSQISELVSTMFF